MILTVDVGNTNITIGAFEDKTLKFTARMATDVRRTGDQYAVELYDLMRLNGYTAAVLDGAVICSVVPPVGDAMQMAIEKLSGIKAIVVGPGVKTGLNIKIDNPAQLGADLVAGAVGAIAKYPMPCIIIDMGTATTLSVLDKNGSFLGGVIAAGVGLTLDALTSHTAQLPSISVEAPEKAIGTNTVQSMQAGLVFGTASMIDGLIARIEIELGSSTTVVATGGRAAQIINFCEKEILLDDNLLLDGLIYIYNKNQ